MDVIKFKRITGIVLAALAGIAALLVNIETIMKFFSSVDDGVSISLSLEEIPYDYTDNELYRTSSHYQVTYKASQDKDKLTIVPESDYFNNKIKPVEVDPSFALSKIGIGVKIVNNSNSTIYLHDANLIVDSSSIDKQPVMVLNSGAELGKVIFNNEGWGEPDNVIMKARVDGTTINIRLPYEVNKISWIPSNEYSFDIVPLLQANGFSSVKYSKWLTLYYKRREQIAITDDEAAEFKSYWRELEIECFRSNWHVQDSHDYTDDEILNSPQGCTIPVTGELYFQWTTSKEVKNRLIKFSKDVTVLPYSGYGSGGFEATGEYDIQLRTDSENYMVSASLSQPIPAGGYDRFILWLGAKKSSRHTFKMQLLFNEDQAITSKLIELEYLMPKSNSGWLHKPFVDKGIK